MSLTSGNNGNKPSNSSYQLLEEGKVNNTKQRGIQKGHGVMVALVMVFIALSAFFSILPGQSKKESFTRPRPNYGMDAEAMRLGTSTRSLTWAERNDRTFSDERCRQEFPLLYPQLEEISHYWKERGGLNKSIIDRNEEHVKLLSHVGYTRVSRRRER